MQVNRGTRTSLRAAATLVRWLGPWESSGAPSSIARDSVVIEGARAVKAHVYAPSSAPRGVWVVAPGLHFLGPDDPRLDRFCRILAASGTLVVAPFLPDHVALRVSPRTTDDLEAVVAHATRISTRERLPPPALFSISFGSQPAIALAARDVELSALVLFGGFAEFETSVRFCLTGRATYANEALSLPHDPLNAPVVWLHLLDHLDLDCNRVRVESAFRTMVTRTWGRAELKLPGARDAIAHDIAASLDERDRAVFLLGCGLADRARAAQHLDAALARLGDAYAFTDPRPHLAKLRAPIAIVHGRDDDVIPWFEAEKLRAALPQGHPHRMLVTGLYGHTGAGKFDLRVLGRELATMIAVVRSLVDAPTGRLSSRR